MRRRRYSTVLIFEMSPDVTLSNKTETKARFKRKSNMHLKLFSKKNHFCLLINVFYIRFHNRPWNMILLSNCSLFHFFFSFSFIHLCFFLFNLIYQKLFFLHFILLLFCFIFFFSTFFIIYLFFTNFISFCFWFFAHILCLCVTLF